MGSECWSPQVGVDRKVVFELLEIARKSLKPGGFGIVSHGDEGLECRLVVEPLVLVDLVGPDRRFDRRVELHPGHITRIIVVGGERFGPQLEIPAESWVRRELRGRAQLPGRDGQEALIFDIVGHHRQLAIRPATDGCEIASGRRALLVRKPFDPLFDLFSRGVGGVVVRPFRFGRDAGNKALVVLQSGPRTFVDEKEVQTRLPACGRFLCEFEQEGGISGPHLFQEDRVHHLGGGNDGRQRSTFVIRQCVERRPDFDLGK